jgi:hypothetical protein
MAKKEEEPITRVMREQIGGGFITIGDGALSAGQMPGYVVTDTSTAVLVHSLNNYFDLEGYSIRDLTTYIQTVLFQKVGRYNFGGMQVGVDIVEILCVSTVPLSLDDDFTIQAFNDSVPGSLTSLTSSQDVVTAQLFVYSQDDGAGFGRIIESNAWGLADSTAADRLYFSRYFLFPKTKVPSGNASYGFTWSELVVALPVVIAKEADLEYIMRLSRSVQTQLGAK